MYRLPGPFGVSSTRAGRTTPESLDLSRLLDRYATAGAASCAMEVSSHSLALDRVAGIAFRAALTGAQIAWERLRLVTASLPETEEVRDEWRLWLTFWGEVTRNERLRAVSERQHRRWTRFLARIIAEGSASGEFAMVDPDITATQVAALIDGLAIQTTLQNPALSPTQMRQICLGALQQLLYSNQSAQLMNT